MGFENIPTQENESAESPFERASQGIDALLNMRHPEVSGEEKEGLAETIKKRLEDLESAEKLKLTILGDKRSIEPSGSETWGEGLDMEDATVLFGLEHTYESLSPDEPALKEGLEGTFGKEVEIIRLDSEVEDAA